MSITLEGHIGEGFFGQLHRAQDGELPVIVEVLSSPGNATGLEANIEKLAGVTLPGALQTIKVARLEEGVGLVYEDFPGQPLSQLLSLAPSSRALVEIFSQVSGALHAAWAQPVGGGGPLSLVHGGLDLRRIWVDASGTVKLEGIGQADSGAAGPCVPPEQSASHGGDVFSLGWLLSWALLGERPVLSLSDDALASEVSILAVRVREHTDDERLAALIEDTLRFSPAARPPAATLISSLSSIADKMSGASLSEWAAAIPAPPARQKKRKSRLFSSFSGALLDEAVVALPEPGRLAPRPVPVEPELPAPKTATQTPPLVDLSSLDALSAPPSGASRLFSAVQEPTPEPVGAPSEEVPPAETPLEEPPAEAPPEASKPAPVESAVTPEAPSEPEIPEGADLPEPQAVPPPPPIPDPPAPDDIDLDEPAPEVPPEPSEWSLQDAEDIDDPDDWETSPVSSGVAANPLAKPKSLTNPESTPEPPPAPEDIDGAFFSATAAASSRAEDEYEEAASQRSMLPGVLLLVASVVVFVGWLLTRPGDAPTEPVAALDPAEEPAEEPAPTEPAPTEPAPTEPAPTELAPTEEPAPAEAAPTEAAPPEEPSEEPEPPPVEVPPTVEPTAAPPPEPEPTVAPRPDPEPVVSRPVEPPPVRPAPPVEEPIAVAPPAEEPEPEESGSLSVTGDAVKVRLQGGGRSFGSGSVPVGRYEIMVTVTADGQPMPSGSVSVSSGEVVRVNCSAAFMRCQVR